MPSTGVSLIEPGAMPTGSTINATSGTSLGFRALLAGSIAPGGLTATWLVDGSVSRIDNVVHGSVVRFDFPVPRQRHSHGRAAGHRQHAAHADTPADVTAVDRAASEHYARRLDQGTGSGSVSSNPAGITCGATCTMTFSGPTLVDLTATPASGSMFVGWLGACTGAASICTVTASSATRVTATFAPATLLLRLDVDGNAAYRAPTDGVLAMRYLLGLSAGPLVTAAIGTGATRSTPTTVTQYLDTWHHCSMLTATALLTPPPTA